MTKHTYQPLDPDKLDHLAPDELLDVRNAHAAMVGQLCLRDFMWAEAHMVDKHNDLLEKAGELNEQRAGVKFGSKQYRTLTVERDAMDELRKDLKQQLDDGRQMMKDGGAEFGRKQADKELGHHLADRVRYAEQSRSDAARKREQERQTKERTEALRVKNERTQELMDRAKLPNEQKPVMSEAVAKDYCKELAQIAQHPTSIKNKDRVKEINLEVSGYRSGIGGSQSVAKALHGVEQAKAKSKERGGLSL